MKQKRGEKAADDTDEPADFLVDPEPWGEPVDGADLLDRIVDAVNAHMIVPKGRGRIGGAVGAARPCA